VEADPGAHLGWLRAIPRRGAEGIVGAELPAGIEGVDLELRAGPIEQELRALAADGVQSLLLEGGPTLAASFLEADLVDKILLFIAPTLAGTGPPAALQASLPSPRTLARLHTRQVGADVLLEAYVHEP